MEFEVVNSRNQVETHSESLSTITIPFTQDTKYFQLTKNMFNQDPFSSQDTIFLLLSLRQSVMLGFLEGRLTVLMQVRQSLVACIGQNAKVIGEITAIVLEQLKIVFAAIAKRCGNNFGALAVSNYLCFLSMSLLFATVMPFLPFLDAPPPVR